MKEEIKNLWIEALRSGEYKQGKGRLKNYDNSFCCLGVLCDISRQGNWNEENYYYLSESSFLPNEVQEWAEMRTFNGKVFSRGTLTTLNDHGKSFEEIADFIEKNWEEL